MRLKLILASTSLTVLAGLIACATPSEEAAAPVAPQAAAPAPVRTSYPAAYRRLTENQYRNAVRDIFGPAISINARFEPERREEGLQAVGAARLSITTSGLEQYQAVARSIADQVVDGKDRDALVGCAPSADAAAGKACAEAFIQRRGAELFRRPVTRTEQAMFGAMFDQAQSGYGDFHKALKLTLVGMLMSPEFLFRVERAEPDAASPGGYRLDAYTKAARLSYLLWNAAPDAPLMDAARNGELHTETGLARQVDRMLTSPKMEDGVRAFFSDMLMFEAFETLSKDSATYPKFSQSVADSAKEETLRFLVDHLVRKGGDYRDVFTSRDTQIDRALAYVYNVPYLSSEKWSAYSFPAESERSGLLTQATFMSLFAHPGSSSPTLRGVALNEIFLCVTIPLPPPDVDFSKVQALEKGTVRTRLLDHLENPGCAGCHRISDPIGLALERFDGLGQHRTRENNDPIDVSAEIGQAKFTGAQGVGQYLKNDERSASCLVRKVHYYGVGRPSDPADSQYLSRMQANFAAGGYRLPILFRSILTDPQFYRVVLPTGMGTEVRTASTSVNPILGDAR